MLSRETILQAFARLASILNDRGITGEVVIIDGAAMMLAFRAREATKDVDAIFAPQKEVREAARLAALDLSLPQDWLNDAAKGFLSDRGDFSEQAILQFPGLRVLAPSPGYMLAMKVLAARTGSLEGADDKKDIRFLVDLLDLSTAAEVMEMVTRYYAPSMVLPKSAYLVDEVMEERRSS